MKAGECTDFLERRFKTDNQEKWDNCGIQVLHEDEQLKGILCALDCTQQVIDEAVRTDCNLIVTHHPLIFTPVRSLSSRKPVPRLLMSLVDKRISVLSLHTCLDREYWAKAAVVLGMPFEGPFYSMGDTEGGYGVLMNKHNGIDIETLCELVKEKFRADHVRVSSNDVQRVKRILFIAGSGSSYIDELLETDSVDCIITGDVTYHKAQAAVAAGIALIDAGHFFTEKNYLAFLRDDIEQCVYGELAVKIAVSDISPFRVY